MIINKKSATIGFSWYFLGILKLITSVATITMWKSYTTIGVIGIIALLGFSYEHIKEYKRLSKGN